MKHNKALLLSEMTDPTHATNMFNFSRKSPEVKRYNELNQQFLQHVQIVRKQAMIAKKALKQKKLECMVKLINDCRPHGGPVTCASIDQLDQLTMQQLKSSTGADVIFQLAQM